MPSIAIAAIAASRGVEQLGPERLLVLTPAQPSTVRPCERWNFSTAARVAGPYLPSTSSSAPSITLSAAFTHFVLLASRLDARVV